ncbi:MAG: DUF5312 domain-containing protein [Treponema sp.]|nr:DUF5312 domain-containing protein [Treponema sp.]
MADSPAGFPGEDKILNRLVSELAVEERVNLLDKLKSQSNLSADLLYDGEVKTGEEEAPGLEESYARLPWYYRIFYFIVGVFRGKPPAKVFEDSRVGRLGRDIDARFPGLYDYQHNVLLPEFYRRMADLKEAARFFYNVLDVSVNRDRGGFYAFLGSLEMGEVHRLLETDTDPASIAGANPSAGEGELRQAAFRAMENAFAGISVEQRNTMYKNARSLFCLKELSSFLFDRVLMAFGFENSASGQVCSVNIVREMLESLNNILCSLREPPPLPLLESLFIFVTQEKAGEQGFELSREMRSLLARSENALATIREFNRQTPLTPILRCANRDLSFQPKQTSGGEDWFIVYREYWKRRIESRFAEYMRLRRHHDLVNSFRYFLKGTNLKLLENVVSESNPDGIPVIGALALSFLLSFYSAVFMADINKILRPVLIDGEFYKRENRTEFTESYNDLIKLEDDIQRFEGDISPAGDLGKRYSLARQDMSSLPVKRRKVQLVVEDASRAASAITGRVRAACGTMINIINGIMKKDPDGKYDTLANLSQLAGKGGSFITGLNNAVEQFRKTLQLLDDIDVMEGRRQ